jgi:oligopeptide/dipeptide ABC transporter ATP-binding protein
MSPQLPSAPITAPPASDGGPVLEIRDLRTSFRLRRGTVRAVDGVDLRIGRGERVGIVGESGCGKSTLALSVMRLIHTPGASITGSVRLEGVELLALSEDQMTRVRGARAAMVYQDPYTFLNPVLRVGDQIAEALRAHRGMSREEARAETLSLLARLHLPHPAAILDAYPHQLSGGQRQRIVIGMAIACRPALLIADEPTTALDVTVQAQTLRLIRELVRDLGMSLLLISHDLSVVAALCDRVYVMYAGQIVESGPVDSLYGGAKHPYTAALLGATTTLLAPRRQFAVIPGAPPDLANPPDGCRFAARCPQRMARCADPPPTVPVARGWEASCWLPEPPAEPACGTETGS